MAEYSRRAYYMDTNAIEQARKVEVLLRVDGETLVRMALRDPGLVSFVRQPGNPGVAVEVVEAGEARYTDVLDPGTVKQSQVRSWQLELLGETE